MMRRTDGKLKRFSLKIGISSLILYSSVINNSHRKQQHKIVNIGLLKVNYILMRAIYLHLNIADLHYIVISAFLGHPPDARLYLDFHL